MANAPQPERPMITADALVKMFGKKVAVDNVSFQVNPGEVLGFLGPNGAGKSTTMRMLTGFLPATSGTITIDGHDMEDDTIAAKAAIGYLPENAPSYPDMTVEAFLNFVADVRGLDGDAKKSAIEIAIATCQLQKVRNQVIDTLSKGYKHRTCFAQAILSDPPILVLDEPTDGLDPNQKHEMRRLIKEMGKTKAIIVSTHILEEVEAICSRVIIIDQGRIVFNGTPAELCAKAPEAGGAMLKAKSISLDALKEALKDLKCAGIPQELQPGLFKIPLAKGGCALAHEVKKLLDSKKIDFEELYTDKGRLESVFQAITTKETSGAEGNN